MHNWVNATVSGSGFLLISMFLSTANAAPLPSELDAEFAFGSLASDSPPFTGPSSYTFSLDGQQQGSAVGATGNFTNTNQPVSFSLNGGFDALGSNNFTAPLTLSFENTSPNTAFSVELNADYSGSVAGSGFTAFSSLAIEEEGDLFPLDSITTFGGTVSKSFNLSGLTNPVMIGPGATTAITLGVVADQSTASLADATSYTADGMVSVNRVTAQPVPVPSTSVIFIVALSMLAFSTCVQRQNDRANHDIGRAYV